MSEIDLALFNIDDGNQVVVFVGDVERLAVGMQNQQLGIGARRQRLDELKRFGVVDLNDIVVAGADDHPLAVLRQHRCRAAAGRF